MHIILLMACRTVKNIANFGNVAARWQRWWQTQVWWFCGDIWNICDPENHFMERHHLKECSFCLRHALRPLDTFASTVENPWHVFSSLPSRCCQWVWGFELVVKCWVFLSLCLVCFSFSLLYFFLSRTHSLVADWVWLVFGLVVFVVTCFVVLEATSSFEISSLFITAFSWIFVLGWPLFCALIGVFLSVHLYVV